MSGTFQTFKSKPKRLNILAKNIELLFLGSTIVFFTNSILSETGLIDQIIKSIFLLVAIAFGIHFIKRTHKEPAFIKITIDEIEIRPTFYLFARTIPLNKIEGFSLINRPYYLNHGRYKLDYNAHLIYLKNERKIILSEYYFENYFEIRSSLKKVGVKYMGKEVNDWSAWRRTYKYDDYTPNSTQVSLAIVVFKHQSCTN